jgi:hypothetical protein
VLFGSFFKFLLDLDISLELERESDFDTSSMTKFLVESIFRGFVKMAYYEMQLLQYKTLDAIKNIYRY